MLNEQLKLCRICLNRRMDAQTGLYCGLTNAKPAFTGTCIDFSVDQKEADYQIERERQAAAEESVNDGFVPERSGIQKGVLGGILMIVIAVVWFFAGLAADVIFFYPPILFCIGLYALIKGMATGNFTGRKN